MKHPPKRAIVITVVTAVAFIALGVIIGGAAPGFYWQDGAAPSLGLQEKKGIDLLNKRFGVVRISSVLDGKLIGAASSNRLLADVLTNDAVATESNSEILLQTNTGEVLLLESSQKNAETKMITAYSKLWNVEAVEKNQMGELFQDREQYNGDFSGATTLPTVNGSDASVLVAVIDSGIDDHHPALTSGIWKNSIEASGRAGVDDDRNGRTDDIEGWDFVNDSSSVRDTVGHGTHVTGVIAARPTFLSDMTGINPRGTSVMVLKVADDKHGLKLSNVLAALRYAENKNVDVINMSLGFTDDSQIFRSAIHDLKEKGIYLVAAAGNNAESTKQYPAAYPEVLSVGSANIDGGRWQTSNFGEWVDINVPGKLLSTLPDNRYGTKSGTSQAAALITGLYSYYKYAYPEMDDATIETAIIDFAHTFENNAAVASLIAAGVNADWMKATADILKSGRFASAIEIKQLELQKVISQEEAYAFLLEYFGVRSEVIESIQVQQKASTPLAAAPNLLLDAYLHPSALHAAPSIAKSYLSHQEAIAMLLEIEQKMYSKVRSDSPLLLYLNGDSPYISREKFADLVFQAFAQS